MTLGNSFLAIAGTRPEYLKLWPLMRALGQDVALLWSCQQSADPPAEPSAMSVMKLPRPVHPLSRKTLLETLAQNIAAHLQERCPRLVIVQGDTATALAGARAANALNLPVVHLEAGLRSGNLRSPFPEEAYRREITRLATLHLAPSRLALAQLQFEGILPDTMTLVGSTAVDLVRDGCATTHCSDSLGQAPSADIPPIDLLIAVHRRENLSLPLRQLVSASRVLIEQYRWRIGVLLHPNPERCFRVQTAFSGLPVLWLTSMAPIDWWRHACQAQLVLTDSGGALEELPYLGARLCVYRNSIERPEALASGHALHLAPARCEVLVDRLRQAYTHQWPAPWPLSESSPYGDGQAGMRAAAAIHRLSEHRLRSKHLPQPVESVDQMQALAEAQRSILAGRLAADSRVYFDKVPFCAVGAFDLAGTALYAYPEIAGYWLQWASSRSEIDDAAILPLLEWLRSVQCANGHWPTRIGLAETVSPRYHERHFLFDHAMLRRGLAATLQCRGLPLARELLQSVDHGLNDWIAAGSFQASIPHGKHESAHWSNSNGAFLLKARAALSPLVEWQESLASAFPVDTPLLAPHGDSHPQLYAIEGLIGLGAIPSAKAAWAELRKQLDATGQLTESANGIGPVRSDVLAQVLRVALILDGHAEVCTTPVLRRVCAQLFSRVDGQRMLFSKGGPRVAWAGIFAEQALHAFVQGCWTPAEAII